MTVDEELWMQVQAIVAELHSGATPSASAAVERGLLLWVANQRLGRALDTVYDEDPAARPTDDEVVRAAEALGL